MRKLLPLLLVLMLVIAACGGDDDDDDGGGEGIANADTCEDVGAAFMDELQTLMDGLSELEIADISGDEEPEIMGDFEASIEEISNKAEELDCSDEELSSYVQDNFDSLEADGPVAELFLQAMESELQSGDIFETP